MPSDEVLFDRLLRMVTTPPGLPSGRIMLLKGEAGSGKTHLMRALRSSAHSSGLGYFGYMQMTTATNNFAEYILSNLIDSFDRPYQHGSSCGLTRLSNSLFEGTHGVDPELKNMLREDPSKFAGGLTRKMTWAADQVLKHERFRGLDVDVVRALLYLQIEDPRYKGRVMAWLRCEDLSAQDRELLGGLIPRIRADDTQRMIENLAKVMWATQNAALIICLDQLEDMVSMGEAKERFQRAMSTVNSIADRVHGAIVVVSCLADFYTGLREHLTASLRDRVEKDPAPFMLVSGRSIEEVHSLIRTRLDHLYNVLDAPFKEREPLYPFTAAQVSRWANLRTRDVLENCRAAREHAIRTQSMPAVGERPAASVNSEEVGRSQQAVVHLEQLWNDHLAAWKVQASDDEVELAELLAQTISKSSVELESGHSFVTKVSGRFIEVDVLFGAQSVVLEELTLGLCNRGTQNGGLERQINELVEKAGTRVPVAVRSSEFAKSPKTKIAERVGQLITGGGRKAVIEPVDWRAMAAMRAFEGVHSKNPAFVTWLGAENPLSRLQGVRQVLNLAQLVTPIEPRPLPVVTTAVAQPAPPTPPPAPRSSSNQWPMFEPKNVLTLGTSRDVMKSDVSVELAQLTRHAAFLGGSGSGKTTLAMYLIEEALARGVPAVLIDRKGDLSSYAAAGAWTTPARDDEHSARRQALRDRLQVAVYTPGNPNGRPLAVPLAPKDLQQMAEHEREMAAGHSAAGLGSMMGHEKRNSPTVAALQAVIEFLAEMGGEISLDSMLEVIATPPNPLVAKLGQLDLRVLRKLGQELQALKLTSGSLFKNRGEAIDIDTLLGRGADAMPGKTRLSIINTKFLGDTSNVLFVVSQLLMAMSRWTSKNPSTALQGMLFVDEADLYLPASSKPPTKEPLETLLRRARSAGLSVMLATQSPGDLDYRCRDNIQNWFVGQVKENTALNKMKPMLAEAKVDIASKIPAQKVGEFHFVRSGSAVPFQSRRAALSLDQMSEDDILEAAAG